MRLLQKKLKKGVDIKFIGEVFSDTGNVYKLLI